MRASLWVAVSRRSRLLSAVSCLAVIACAALLLLVLPARAQNLGQWSPLQAADMHGVPVHMALMPGDGSPYHSRVLWWGYDAGKANGSVLGWIPDVNLCGSFPDGITNLVPLLPWNTDKDLFCGTQITLADGRLASFGGTDRNYWGLDSMLTYPRRVAGSASGTWTPPGGAGNQMNEQRWYPTATLLRTDPPPATGRVLVSAGTKSNDLWFYGGRRNGLVPSVLHGGHKLERSGRVDGGSWDPSLATIGDATNNERPLPREGHTLVNLAALEAPVLFGGSDSVGGRIQNPTTFVWTLIRKDGGAQDPDYQYQWVKQPVAPALWPADRTEHTALAVSPTEMIIFGGVDDPSGTDQAFWRFYKDPITLTWKWARVTLDAGSGSPPPARYGHAAVYDSHDYGATIGA